MGYQGLIRDPKSEGKPVGGKPTSEIWLEKSFRSGRVIIWEVEFGQICDSRDLESVVDRPFFDCAKTLRCRQLTSRNIEERWPPTVVTMLE